MLSVIYIWLMEQAHEALLNRNDEKDQRDRGEALIWPDLNLNMKFVPVARELV